MTADDVLRRSSAYALHHIGKITRTDAETVGIERHFPMVGTMLMNQPHEHLEQFFLTADSFRMAVFKQPMCLVVDVKQEALKVVAQNLWTETVVPILVQFFD